MDFQDIRKEYENLGIDESALVEKSPGKWLEPNAMSLATSDAAGKVSNRYVLMKEILDEGIQFFTNYESQKGQQLQVNENCAVAFHWPYLGRQVRIEGAAEKTSREVSETYFHSRPRGSQIGAAASLQSSKVETRELLDQQRRKLGEEFEGQPVPLPENWGGYLIRPRRFEFWQGRLDRLHDRIVFENQADGWSRYRLSP